MFKHILLATDGSAASDHAAQLAVDLARVHGATLTALYVVDPYPYLGVGESNPLGFQVTRYRRDAETLPETLPQAGAVEPRVARPSPAVTTEAPVVLRRAAPTASASPAAEPVL